MRQIAQAYRSVDVVHVEFVSPLGNVLLDAIVFFALRGWIAIDSVPAEKFCSSEKLCIRARNETSVSRGQMFNSLSRKNTEIVPQPRKVHGEMTITLRAKMKKMCG